MREEKFRVTIQIRNEKKADETTSEPTFLNSKDSKHS